MAELEKRIKNAEQEIIDLKTSSQYTSIRSINFSSGFKATIGTYRATFSDNNGVLSLVYCSDSEGVWGSGIVYGRTPSGNTQIIEVGYSEYALSGSSSDVVPITIISNSPVQSIQKLT
jgi:hypothetical protein